MMKKNAIYNLFVIFSTLLLLVSISVLPGYGKEITLGAILPLTGDSANWGESGKEGMEFAVSEINSQGGINGQKLSIIYEDTQAQPDRGASAMLKLATVDKVPAVVGDIVSATTLAAAPIAETNKVVLLSPTASAPKLTGAGKFIFRIWPSDTVEGTKIAEFAADELHLKRVAILYIQNDYGIGLRDVFKKEFAKRKGQITDAVAYKAEETNFRSYLQRIQKKNPEAIYVVSYYKDGAIVLKQARSLRIKARFLGATALEDPKLLEIAGDAAEGVIYPVSSGYDPKNKNELVTAFIQRFKTKYGKEPGFIQAQFYDAVKLIAYVMAKGNLTGESIQKGFENLKNYPGVTGVINFDKNGDVHKPSTIRTIKQGQFVPYNG